VSEVLVTGAAGFLGRSVVPAMLARGHEVRAMVQRESDARLVRGPRAKVAIADLLDPASLRGAVAGIEIVCHCAAKLPGKASPEAIWAANVTGTANLLAACVEARVRRLVYVSTDSVYGDASTAGATEDSPIEPGYLHEGDYPRSKLEGEKLALQAFRERGLEVAIIRTCLMYGPGRSAGTDVLRHWASRRVHPLLGGGAGRISMAYVTDVAEAVALAAESRAAVGRAYNVSSGEPHAKRDILGLIAEVTGRRAVFLPLPGRALLPAARALHAVLAPLSPGLAGRVDPRRILFSVADHAIDIGRIRRELGFEPRVSLREGLRRTFAPGRDPASPASPEPA